LLSKFKKIPKQAVHLCAACLLLGCTQVQKAPVEKPVEQENAKHSYLFSVQPQSPHAEFSTALQSELKADPLFLGTHARDAGQLIISAIPQIQIDPLNRSRTPSFGKLAAQTVALEIRVPYTLSTYNDQVLHSGEIRYITEPLPVISPTVTIRPDIPKETWEDISSMLLTDVSPALGNIPWNAQVIGIIDSDHATLNIGKESRLPARTIMKSSDITATFAEIVIYEKNDRGTSRAILKHISGPPFAANMSFTPVVPSQ
jgi:hypothetical protein